MKPVLILWIASLVSCGTITGQTWPSGNHDMFIVPNEPTEADDILLVLHAFLPHSPCQMIIDSLEVEMLENEITVQAHYTFGMLTMPCFTADTIVLGQLPVGQYHLTTYFNHSEFWGLDSLSFSVTSLTSTGFGQQAEKKVNIFPNPNSGEILQIELINSGNELPELTIYNLMGSEVFSKQLSNQNTQELALPPISPGLYFVTFHHGGETFSEKLIIK